jgi:hypothetical protein
MDRRTFLKLVGVSGAAAVLPEGSPACGPAAAHEARAVHAIWVPDMAMVPRGNARMFSAMMPKNWNEGEVIFEPMWSGPQAGRDVRFAVRCARLPEDDEAEIIWSTEAAAVDTCLEANVLHIAPPIVTRANGDSAVLAGEVEVWPPKSATLHGIKILFKCKAT